MPDGDGDKGDQTYPIGLTGAAAKLQFIARFKLRDPIFQHHDPLGQPCIQGFKPHFIQVKRLARCTVSHERLLNLALDLTANLTPQTGSQRRKKLLKRDHAPTPRYDKSQLTQFPIPVRI